MDLLWASVEKGGSLAEDVQDEEGSEESRKFSNGKKAHK